MSGAGVLIIGSGAAGISAAEAYRDAGGHRDVTVVSAEESEPYFRPSLSKDFLQGLTHASATGMLPKQWFSDRAIDLIHGDTVISLDVRSQCAATSAGRRILYSHLILACGADPKRLSAPGGNDVAYLRTLRDAESLRRAAIEAESAIVIGAGFIGCEAAASLSLRGIVTTLLASDEVPQENRLGFAAGERIAGLLTEAGVRLVGDVKVSAVQKNIIRLDDGTSLAADLILSATGVLPRIELAARAGIRIVDGRIAVDEHMRTSIANVYAAGDVALAAHRIAGRPVRVEHWQDAITHGRIAGANAAGESRSWSEVPGFWTTIGTHTLKYSAWGDGYGRARLVEKENGFTVWYETNGIAVGVLTSEADCEFSEAQARIRAGATIPF